jgi:hypothetical protein
MTLSESGAYLCPAGKRLTLHVVKNGSTMGARMYAEHPKQHAISVICVNAYPTKPAAEAS